MTSALNDQSLDQIFRSARTPNGWADRPIEDDTVREIYDLMKWGPTSANCSPARFVWLRSAGELPKLLPHNAELMQKYFAAPGVAEVTAMRNGTLQGAYLIVAARALGLDCGPMSGFDNAGVDKAFFSGTRIESNFICSIGYGDPASVFPRNPRLSFEEAGRRA